MEDRKLDRALRARVRGFYHYYLQRKSVFNGAVVLREVSSALRNDIAVHLYSDYVHRIPFFATQEPSFLALVCGRLVPFYAAAGDTILEVGVIASDLFFILSGKVEALASSAPDAPSFGVLGDGEYFGEGALLALTAAAEAAGGGASPLPASPSPTSRGRAGRLANSVLASATIKALCQCDLLSLGTADMQARRRRRRRNLPPRPPPLTPKPHACAPATARHPSRPQRSRPCHLLLSGGDRALPRHLQGVVPRRQTPRDAAACGHPGRRTTRDERHRSLRADLSVLPPCRPEPMRALGRARRRSGDGCQAREATDTPAKKRLRVAGRRRPQRPNLHATHHLGRDDSYEDDEENGGEGDGGTDAEGASNSLPSRL